MSVERYVSELMRKSRAAQARIADFTQQQVDTMVRRVGLRGYKEAEVCGKMVLKETGKGDLETKVLKHERTVMWMWWYLQDEKSVGVVEEIPKLALQKVAKPAGTVCCVVPITEPTSFPFGNTMMCLKARNSIIVCPHPSAKKSTAYACFLMRDELKRMGLPEDLVQVVQEPSHEISELLMKHCDVTIAAGGPSVVEAAYSSGRPAFGVGQGNAQNILAPDYDDIKGWVTKTINNRVYDNGMPCTTDQTLHVPMEKVEQVITEFESQGAYMVRNLDAVQKLREAVFQDGKINQELVGKSAGAVAKAAGIPVKEDTRLLLCMVEKCGEEGADVLSREIMCPFCRILPYENVEDAVEHARLNHLLEGAGHASCIYSNDEATIAMASERIPVGRLVVNQPPTYGTGCSARTGIPPTCSLGCGFWGKNGFSNNLSFKDLMNYTYVIKMIPGVEEPTPEQVWCR